ncbi:MAG: hypothetical protein SGI77_25650 [Pirellulaceae bacterium]|nr:hypothetical protein [Pirellulaceae bacterium]
MFEIAAKHPLRKPVSIGVGLCLALTTSPQLQADSLLLKNGTLLEGRCLNAADKNATEWQIETDSGLTFTISRSDVKDFRPSSAVQQKYVENIAKVDDVLKVHQSIVRWCLEKGLNSLADAHWERIVELDPSDKTAWAALEYVNTADGWIRRNLFQMRRGLVQKGGRWYVAQDLAIQQMNDQAKLQSAQVKKSVTKAINEVRNNSPKAAEGRQYLAELKDPLAIAPLKELLENDRKNSNNQFRMLLIEIIARIRTSGSVLALIDSAVYDPDRSIRAECVSKLSEFGSEMAVQSMLGLLTNRKPDKDQPELYDRVGEALVMLGDERCIPRLMDCLVTKHLRAAPTQPSYQAGMTTNSNLPNANNASFGTGQKKPEVVQIQNQGVLSALQEISNNQPFGYDEKAWRDWYARTYAPSNLYVLRDP